MTSTTEFRLSILSIVCLVLVGCGGAGSGGGSIGGGGGPVAVAPNVTVQPVAATVADGATANFSVTATGDAPLNFQWRRNGVDLVSGAGVVGATTATLALTSPYAFDASQLSVRVTNSVGSVTSNNALLTVTPIAPVIVTQPISNSVASGTSASFSVVVSGGTSPITYQWKRNGVAIPGAVSSTYSLTTTPSDNSASFSVAITNPATTITSSAATLTITAPAKIWGAATLLNSNNADLDANYPDVAIDGSGNAIAVWMEILPDRSRYSIFAARYSAGSTWTTAESIGSASGSAITPTIAMTPSGAAAVAFAYASAPNGGVINMGSTRFDGVWHTPSLLEFIDTNAVDPDVAVASSGAATVVFSQSDGTGSRIWVNQSTPAGVWATPLLLGNVFADSPQVAVAANGHAVMTWAEDSNAGRYARTLWASGNIGAGWSTPVKLVMETGPLQSKINLAIDAQGNATAVWSQEISLRNIVRVVRLDDQTGIWSAALTLNDGAHDALSPQIAANSQGDTIVVWSESDLRTSGANAGLKSSRFNVATGTWSAAIAIQPNGATPGSDPIVGIDDAGNAIATWLQPSESNALHRQLWAAHSTATNTTWATPIKLTTDDNSYIESGYLAKLAVNGNGEAVVTWYQKTDTPRTAGIWARVYR